MQNAAILWTGGKDSAMALYEAEREGYHIRCLVTFAPPEPRFLAHPLALIRMQARALGLPHHVLTIRAPFEQGYEAGLRRLKEEMGIDCVVTGDIAAVNGSPNWIRERSRPVGMAVYTPLWGRDRHRLLQQLVELGFKVRFSCVDTRWLDAGWVGRELNKAAIAELRILGGLGELDLCGEQGEYHTMVVDGPGFAQGIDILAYSRCSADPLAYMDIHELALKESSG
ncbi:Dph6-related ATP pyrophosphatase [Zobellella maritima]|uniref:Dph6-related ATP pyrophosphatase n=1 Tax=Zobellella maritima TaxID=2059725 RepID=UPI0013004E07|nr:diphthine--ammonia ligase [Zobellella maritima]